MKPSEILNGAVDKINEHGWCQGSLFKPDGRLCLMGALRLADGQYIKSAEATGICGSDWTISYARPSSSFERALNRVYDVLGIEPASFNDDRETSEEDVKMLLKETAYSFEQEGN